MAKQEADVICLQETKAQEHQLTAEIFRPAGYHAFYHDAQKKGYSGVALYCRRKPDKVTMGLNWPDFDSEGRYVQADYGRLSIASLYMPSGSSSPERQAVKFDIMARMMPLLKKKRRQKRDYIICGDWNIAHKQIDLKNWRGNQKNSGFLPEERAWLDELFGAVGYLDAFREVNQQPDQYTWWSSRGQAWAKNVGWRIDYQVASPTLRDKIKSATIYKAQRFSDHAPLTIEYDYDL
ncbi:MAG: exodeoxyribonuclease III [Gammaproteobacteria bacterium]|nr:MAG: exodeoxyribonuclease III [Gammaproteobacteria bacterium]TND03464.1 MAG: exodeoxyribonuclease III [Gammaproteobacteria bacterium]